MVDPSYYTNSQLILAPRFLQMMSGPTSMRAALFFLFIFFIASSKLSYCMRNRGIACPEIEEQSLLIFKQSLEDPYSLLSSWNGELNCCKWKGVICNNLTGHVHELHVNGLGGKINPSLLTLKHLRHLDLSQNNFSGETIPSFIGSFANLEYLNLSWAGFYGKIPHNIGNLSNLHTLDMGSRHWRQGLNVDSLEWLSGLSQLEYLNMNCVNLSKATNWAQVINTLPYLVELHLSACSLDNFMAPPNDVNITSLTVLDLSFNYVQSFAMPTWFFQLSNLISLNLEFNSLNGPIPTISNATKLQYIDLSVNYLNSSIPDWLYLCKDLEFVSFSHNFLQGTISNAIANLTFLRILDLGINKLSGKIPREIGNFCKLRWLYLSFNELQGDISNSFGNMSECFLGTLEFLYLHYNKLSGHLIDQFGEFKSLQMLHLSHNSLSGSIPPNLGKLTSLRHLLLADNKFTGNIPEILGQLLNLEVLEINNNMLEGLVTEGHFANLTKLHTFSASGNQLTLKVSPNWIPPFQLHTLKIGSWNLGVGSPIPSWIETQRNIGELDLSNTGISGSVPSWFWDMQFLNLSHNHLYGKILCIRGPEKEGSQYIYLSSNQFSGPLPQIGDIVRELDLSNNSFSGGISHLLCDMTNEIYGLEILHLGGNQLSGELPDCWMKWPSLRFLSLSNNNMYGSIPNSIGFLADLRSLNLNSNKYSGLIPFSMHNCTKLLKIDLADNDLEGNVPIWMGTSPVKLRILILHSNKLRGKISPEICQLNYLQILDLSDNMFSDIIPRCISNFTAMATTRSLPGYDYLESPDYSYSIYTGAVVKSATIATKGSELQYDTILPLVTSIDLSQNNLSGDIPNELTTLVELRSLNLSENHLIGLIPKNFGNMKQLESLDISRNSLSGQIPNSFALLSSLNHLNLSYNNLTGKIPESTQLLGLDPSSFIGNNLCGLPLTSDSSCDRDKVHGHKEDNKDKGDESKIEWLYIFLSLGYAVGFSGVCTTLLLKKSWREAYFGLLECMWDKLYVYVCIKWTRLTRPSGPNL